MEIEMIVLRLQALITKREIEANKLSRIDDEISSAVNLYISLSMTRTFKIRLIRGLPPG